MDCFKRAIIVTLGKNHQCAPREGCLGHARASCFAPVTPTVLFFLTSPTRSTTNHCKLTIMSSWAWGWQITWANLMDSKQKVFLRVSAHIEVLMSSAELMSYLYKPLPLSRNWEQCKELVSVPLQEELVWEQAMSPELWTSHGSWAVLVVLGSLKLCARNKEH